MVKRILSCILLCVFVVSIAACGGNDPSSVKATKTKDGIENTHLKIKDGKDFIAWKKDGVVMTTVTFFEAKKGMFSMSRPAGKFYILVVAVKNEQKDAITVSSASFKIVDKNSGTEYEEDSGTITELGCIDNNRVRALNLKVPLLESLNPGLTQCYWMVYDLPYNSWEEVMDQCCVVGSAGMTGGKVTMPMQTKQVEKGSGDKGKS